MPDASDEQEVQDRRTKIGRQKATDAQVIKNLLSTESGRSWVSRFLEFCHIFSQSFTTDPYATAFNEGQRSVGLRFLADIVRADPDAYVIMMKEKNDGRYEP